MQLCRVSSKDYGQYQRFLRRLVPSMNIKGEPETIPTVMAEEYIQMNQLLIPTMQMFIECIGKSNVEAYFLKNEEKDNIGLVYLVFCEKTCCITEFGILPQHIGKGIGREFFNMLLEEVIKPKQCKAISLKCPYPGAQQFYLKMGFKFTGEDESCPMMRMRVR